MTLFGTLSGGPYSEHGIGTQVPTSAMGRKGLAGGLSWIIHGIILALALSGILPSPPIVQPPPEMVVEMVAEPPPPPPPPEPEAAKPQPPPPVPQAAPPPRKMAAPPKPLPQPQPKPAPTPVQPAPLATAPSPAADAPVMPPVSAPAQPAEPVAQPAPPPPPAGDGEGTKRYLNGIQKLAEQHLVYPPLSLRRGEQGEIHVHVKVTRTGEVLAMDAGSEGTGRLREAALAAIRESAPFPPLPQSIGGDPVDIVVPVRFIIN
jgi:protein TonB